MSNHPSNLLYLSIIVANLALPFVAIVDTKLMGNLDDASYLTATSIASSLFSLIFLSFGFLRMGTVGMVAQAHGAKQYNEIVDLVFRNITFNVYHFNFFNTLIWVCKFLNYQMTQKNILRIIFI